MVKLPKTIDFCGLTWKIETDKTTNGSWYDAAIPKIVIGTKDKSFVFQSFIHELFEAACDVSLLKFRDWHGSSGLNNNMKIVMNHNELENLISQITLPIQKLCQYNK